MIKMLNKQFTNQSGASAIMFTLFFVMVISLISVGYATLARRDQRATLDKTLSNQAQYVAESGIAAVKQYIDNNPGTAKNHTECDTALPTDPSFKMPAFTEGLEITCLTWNMSPKDIRSTIPSMQSYAFNNTNNEGANTLEWSTTGKTNNYAKDSTLDKLPDINSNNKSIIKMVMAYPGDFNDTANRTYRIVYLVPFDSPGDVYPNPVTDNPCPGLSSKVVDLGNSCQGSDINGFGNSNGLVYFVPCPSASNTCSVEITGYPYPELDGTKPGYANKYFSFTNIGAAAVSFTFGNLSGNSVSNVQTDIDVNVKAQDQYKRVRARSSLPGSISNDWAPSYTIFSNTTLCKDIKINGDNTKSVNGASQACPGY